MRRGESEVSIEESINRRKWPLVVLDLIIVLVALANFSVCIWIRFDLDFSEWIIEIGWYSYFNAVYVVMVAMLFAVVGGAVSGYAAIVNSRCMLWTSMALLVLTWILEFGGAIIISLYGFEESHVLINDLRQVFFRLINEVDNNWRAARVLNMVQEYVGCCGAIGSEDYIAVHKPVPMECRDPVRGVEYRYGCSQKFAWWLEPWTATLAGICVGFLVAHVIVAVLTARLISQVQRYKRVKNEQY